ncbi:MAG: thiamine phosphate synthase [Bacteroidales bacterium]|nr:thiamine phosphate synthase [Bacteroidales bacterium]
MVQFVSQSTPRYSHVDTIRLALQGGCRWVQLRMKDSPDYEIIAAAAQVRQLCDDFNAVFIIDDHVELVKQIHADGVHLGSHDMPISQARQILGNEVIIGGTANDLATIRKHYDDGADYVGLGPYRFTTTKKNLSAILGLEGVKSIGEGMAEQGFHIPIVVIGGINAHDIADIMPCNMDGIAISGIVANAANPVNEMKNLLNEINKWKN